MIEQRNQAHVVGDEQSEKPQNWPGIVYHIQPSGYCAGIIRTEKGLDLADKLYPNEEKWLVGTPAHNQTVIDKYRDRGWVMVEGIDEVPKGAFTALGPHGSTDQDLKLAREHKLTILDTECPLVTDVKKGIRSALRDGNTVILWGKEGHAETRAHLGISEEEFDEEARSRLLLGSSSKEILSDEFLSGVKDPEKVAFYAQTTHNADEAQEIRRRLAEKFPNLESLKSEGVCYATRDRQNGIIEMNKIAEERGLTIIWVVIGDPTSSNSKELYKLATKGEKPGVFVLNANELTEKHGQFFGFDAVAVTAGASAPAEDIDGILAWFEEKGSKKEHLLLGRDESKINFKLPPIQRFGNP